MNVKIKNVNIIYMIILSTVSFLWFFFNSHTAYEWPAKDNMPFFERYYDKDLLVNDFFTNSISNNPNPRWVFGYFIIGLSEVFRSDYYTILYTLKIFLVLLMPVMYYLLLYLGTSKFVEDQNLRNLEFIFFFAVLIVINPYVAGIFSIAWWPPYFVQATPQCLSMFFGLFGILLSEINLKSKKYFYSSIFLFFLSTLIHPSIGIFLFFFFSFLNYIILYHNFIRFLRIFIFGVICPIFIIKLLFIPFEQLDTISFVNIYTIENHSSHYHLKDFGSLTPFSWLSSFIIMIIFLIIPLIYFIYYNFKNNLLLAIIFLTSYLLCIFFQYLFIDIYPNKIIALIGPVRFTSLTYWEIVILWSIMFSNFPFLFKNYFYYKIKIIYCLVIFCIFYFIGILFMDSPKKDLFSKDKEMYKFISTTNKNSVFISFPGNYTSDIPLIGKRAIFVGNGFPFNESYLKEYQMRKELVFGTKNQIDKMKGDWSGEKKNNFFRNKPPEYFLYLSKIFKIDYVVIENKFSSKFKNIVPKFQNNKLKIYKIKEFNKS